MRAPVPLLIRWLILFGRIKYFIILIGACIFALTIVGHKLSKPIYTSNAKLLPPFGEREKLGIVKGALGSIPSSSWWDPSDTNEVNLIIIGILNSRRILDQVVEELDLVERAQLESAYHARRWLKTVTSIEQEKHKMIEIAVSTEDPELSKDIVNAFIKAIGQLERSIRKPSREYDLERIDKKLRETTVARAKLNQEFREFKKEHNLVDIHQQTKAAVELYTNFKKMEAEELVQLSGDSRFYAKKHGRIEELEARLDKIGQLQQNLVDKEQVDIEMKLPALKVLPDLQQKYFDYVADIRMHKELLDVLIKQREVVSLYESGAFPQTTVLDFASEPNEPTSTSLSTKLVLSTIGILFLTLAIILLLDVYLHFMPAFFRDMIFVGMIDQLLAQVKLRPIFRKNG